MDRDPQTGKFIPGNKAAAGRAKPHAAQVANLRAALFDELTEDRLREVVRALIDAATEGDVSAARLVLQYSLGNPVEFDVLQRIEDIEEALDHAKPAQCA
jgi:type VI protein secretion system component VasF